MNELDKNDDLQTQIASAYTHVTQSSSIAMFKSNHCLIALQLLAERAATTNAGTFRRVT